MSSPDLTSYVDLRVFDRGALDIFADALETVAANLPGWVMREGNTEVLLLEGIAQEVDELVFAINRLPGAMMTALLGLFGVEHDPGAAAQGSVLFTLTDATAERTIPAGTRLRVSTAGGSLIEYETDDALVIAAGTLTGTTPMTATTNTTLANGFAVGTPLQLVNSPIFVEAAEVVVTPTGGRLPETDADYLTRGVQVLRRLVATLVLPDHFVRAALAEPGVYRATAIDLYDASTSTNSPGHITVAVLDADGNPLSAQAKTDLEATLEAQAYGPLEVHVIDPTITAVDVTVTVRRLPGYVNADVITNVTEALTDYLSPLTWDWGGTVRRNELVSLIDGVTGVDYVEAGSPTVPAADQTLAGVAPLADVGTITITVTEP